MAELNHPPADSLHQRLAQRAQAAPQAALWLQKRHGIWQAWSAAQAHHQVQAMARGLRAAGLRPSEAVGVISGARVEAVLSLLALQQAGLVPVLMSPNLAPGGVATLAQQAGVVALVAEDQEQVDKVADIQSRLNGLRALWVIDPKGTQSYAHARALPLESLASSTSGRDAKAPQDAGDRRMAALMLFSAGVFSEPRCVDVPQDALLGHVAACEALQLRAGERTASLFGLADPLGLYFALVAPVLVGTVACFGEDRLPSVVELRQCAPQVLAIPARLMDRLRRETAARASRCTGLRRALIQQWVGTDAPGAALRALVGRPVARALGLAACRLVVTGYERMAPVSARFLARLGVATRGLYGLAEAGGPAAVLAHAHDGALSLLAPWRAQLSTDATGQARKAGATGQPPGAPANTDEALQTARLRLHGHDRVVDTGDLVNLDGGAMHLVGRAADLLMLPDGSVLSPSVVEAELMASPYINQAVAVGGPVSGMVALVELDEVTLRDWARQHALAFTTLRSFAQSSEVQALVQQAVAEANQRLPQAARITRAVLLPRALEAANGELTASLALRRAIIRNRYAHRLTHTGEVLS